MAAATLPEPTAKPATITASKAPSKPTKRRHRRRRTTTTSTNPNPSRPRKTTTHSLPPSPWTYLLLHLLSPSLAPLDASTARISLSLALIQSLGDHGAAIPLDILALSASSLSSSGGGGAPAPGEVLIRVPREDGPAVAAALGAWTGAGGAGWVVRERAEGLAEIVGGGRGGGARVFKE